MASVAREPPWRSHLHPLRLAARVREAASQLLSTREEITEFNVEVPSSHPHGGAVFGTRQPPPWTVRW